jgi:hypothetical protein
MSSASKKTQFDFAMTAPERAQLAANGYVVRESVFSRSECAGIAEDCERLMAELIAQPRGDIIKTGSFIFEQRPQIETTVKWESQAEDLIRGLEPFAHLSAALNDWGLDPRLTAPCRTICDADEVVLFTEKLNLKRAHRGGEIQLHQDVPYWEFSPVSARIATAMIFLDDANLQNGCLEVAPGSHKARVKYPGRSDVEGFDTLRMDEKKFDTSGMIALEVPAGSVAFFGAWLVHRSGPNKTDGDRRALLYSYQPAGNPHAREQLWKKKSQ